MAALVEGCRYGLSSEGTNSSDRTLIFVKLTDSALKAVEDFVKFKNATARTASIRFDGNMGTIHIPNLRQDSTRSFGFNVSSLDKDASIQQGSFDCIRQTPSGGPGRGGGGGGGAGNLDNLGALLHKMQIHANEESYEKTRERMATAEQESKKNCAKVIKITGNDKSAVGRKVKLKRPPGSVVPPAATPTSPPFRPASSSSSSSSAGVAAAASSSSSSLTSSSAAGATGATTTTTVISGVTATAAAAAAATGRGQSADTSRLVDTPGSGLSTGSRVERPDQRLERLLDGPSMPTLPVTASGGQTHDRTGPTAAANVSQQQQQQQQQTGGSSSSSGSASIMTSTTTSSCNSSSSNNNNNSNNNNCNSSSSSNSNSTSNGVLLSAKNHSPAQANKANRFSNDIMKRSYRERLIHMLAVRPLKKPEILARLIKEGVKESEKKGMTALLSQITTLKENTFHLLRSAWHEVREEDWPFYSAEEKMLVKKNRASMEREDSSAPRHSSALRVSPSLSGPLTPSNPSSVVSSDSGVHSNHSPSSHSEEATTPNHPHGSGGGGSSGIVGAINAPSAHIGSSGGGSGGGLPQASGAEPPQQQQQQHYHHRNAGGSGGGGRDRDREAERDHHRREHHREHRDRELDRRDKTDSLKRVSPLSSSASSVAYELSAASDTKRARLGGGGDRPYGDRGASGNSHHHHNNNNSSSSSNNNNNNNSSIINNSNSGGGGQSKKSPPISPPLVASAPQPPPPSSGRNPPWVTMGSTGSSYCQSSPECVSPSSQDYKSTGSSPSGDVPEYVARYVEITNQEQRYRYKSDFAAEYPRYRQLHQLLDQVSRKFVDLEATLRKCDYGSDEFRRVASEIMAEYRKSKNDQEYQNAKKTFQYLHEKLGYIKQLVAEFDRVHS